MSCFGIYRQSQAVFEVMSVERQREAGYFIVRKGGKILQSQIVVPYVKYPNLHNIYFKS